MNVVWLGTSVSKVLDKKKFEKDSKVDLKCIKAYSIKEDVETTYPKESFRYPQANFKRMVPEVLKNEEPDILIMETGSIEISNIKVNEALMDTKKSIEEYKKEWFNKVEEDSENLFAIAEEALKKKPDMKIVIVKRLPRYDRSSQDMIGIKEKLSTFANSVYDQSWIKRGCPANIKVVEFQLNSDQSSHLKNIIYDNVKSENFDGVHLRVRLLPATLHIARCKL